MPFLIKYQPLSLCHLYLTPTILSFLSLSVFICSSVRWSVGTLARRRINDGVVVKEPDFYWDTGSFTPTFTNSHTSPSLLAKGSAMSDGSFTPSSTEIPPGGIQHGDNSLLPQRRGSEKKTLSITDRASRWLKVLRMRREFSWTIGSVAENKDFSFEGRKSSKVFIIRKE